MPSRTPVITERPINFKTASISHRLKAFLQSLGTTVYQLSQATARPPFGKGTRAYIRDAFYSEIESGQTPDIYQVAALSRLTGHRFVDWLALFGYQVDEILRLQLELHTERTLMLPGTIYDPLVAVPWIRRMDRCVDLQQTVPLVSAIDALSYAPIGELNALNRRRFVYARVGRRDDMMRPRLAGGSIVRVDPERTTVINARAPRPIYLVQHLEGLCCCYVERDHGGDLILLPDEGAHQIIRCRMDAEATILGTIDVELRPLPAIAPEESVLLRLGHRRVPGPRPANFFMKSDGGPGWCARAARNHIGIRFREAQVITDKIAARLNDDQYRVALGSLSDAETYDVLPRQISKIFSLCIAYGMDLWQYLRAGGVPVDDLDGIPIPPKFLHHDSTLPLSPSIQPVSHLDEIEAVENLFVPLGEVPFFLFKSLGSVTGQPEISIDDIYIWGSREPVFHPLLHGAKLVIVNRRQRQVSDARARSSAGEPPLFLMREPKGRLLAGMCALDGGVLLVRPHSTSSSSVMTFPSQNVEIIGRITAVVRSIGGDAQRPFGRNGSQ